GRMYYCIERCGRKGVRKGAVGAHHVVRVSVFNLCRTIRLQKRAGTVASCRPKCGPHLPRSDESWTSEQALREAVPINVLQRLEGPSNEVIIDKIYAAATSKARDYIIKRK